MGRGAPGTPPGARAAVLPVKGLFPGRGERLGAGRAGEGLGASAARDGLAGWSGVGLLDGVPGPSNLGSVTVEGASAAGTGGANGSVCSGVGAELGLLTGAGSAGFGAGVALPRALPERAGARRVAEERRRPVVVLVLAPIDSRSLRATGGSTVDEADRANSPKSFNLSRTSLLSRPSSLASS